MFKNGAHSPRKRGGRKKGKKKEFVELSVVAKNHLKTKTFCRACCITVEKVNIKEHFESPEHIQTVNVVYCASPNVEVKGMGADVTEEECTQFFLPFGEIQKVSLNSGSKPDVVKITFKKVEDAVALRSIPIPVLYKGNNLLLWAAFHKCIRKVVKYPRLALNKEGEPQTIIKLEAPNISDGKLSLQNTNDVESKLQSTDVSKPVEGAKAEVQKKSKQKSKFLKMTLPEAIDLNLKGDFINQLMSLMSHIRLTMTDIEKMRNVCLDLERTLNSVFPGCRISPFGSVVSGLGMIGSDIDCFCDIKDSRQTLTQDKQFEMMVLRTARKALFRKSISFHNIVGIFNTRIPIIKLTHAWTHLNVDISFKSPLGVANTELLKYLLNTDDRLMPLCIFIKYWAKSMSLIGPNRFTCYAIILLIIFYLQRLSKPILPAVSFLQRNPRDDYFIGCWNGGFSSDNLPANENVQSVISLIEGFFDYYKDFAFGKNVICPYSALVIPFDNFCTLDLPTDYNHYKECVRNGSAVNMSAVSHLMLEDPVQLNRNCTSNVTLGILEDFKQECLASSLVIKKARDKNNQVNLIVNLTSLCKVVPSIHYDKPLCFKLPMNLGPVNRDKLASAFVINKVIDDIGCIFEDILTHVAKCKYVMETILHKVTPNGVINPKLLFNCETYFNMWAVRESCGHRDGLFSVNDEAELSDSIMNTLYSNQEPKAPLVFFDLEVLTVARITEYHINITSKQYSVEFYRFINFILPIIEREVRRYFIP